MALTFHADFETANADLVAIDGDEIHFRARSVRGSLVLWWHFALEQVTRRHLTFVWENAAEAMGGLESLQAEMPLVNPGGREYYRLPPGEIDPDAGTWRFNVEFSRHVDAARLAFCYPYSYSEALRVARGWSSAGVARLETLTQSPGGRDVPVLFFGDPEQAGREMIVAVARQHAGETPGSFTLEGFIEQFIAGGACGRWLRERGLLVVMPVMDPDGVAEGSFGKNQEPVDINRDWTGESKWPQVAAARQLIADLAARHRYMLFLDFHAPCAHEPAFVYLSPDDMVPPEPLRWQRRFVELLAERPCPWFDFHAEDCYVGERHEGMAKIAQANEHGCAAITLETPYNKTRDGRIASPLRYRQHGQAVAEATLRLINEMAGRS